MVIGSSGSSLSYMARKASVELEALLGAPVHIAFNVLVKKPHVIHSLGNEEQ